MIVTCGSIIAPGTFSCGRSGSVGTPGLFFTARSSGGGRGSGRYKIKNEKLVGSAGNGSHNVTEIAAIVFLKRKLTEH